MLVTSVLNLVAVWSNERSALLMFNENWLSPSSAQMSDPKTPSCKVNLIGFSTSFTVLYFRPSGDVICSEVTLSTLAQFPRATTVAMAEIRMAVSC